MYLEPNWLLFRSLAIEEVLTGAQRSSTTPSADTLERQARSLWKIPDRIQNTCPLSIVQPSQMRCAISKQTVPALPALNRSPLSAHAQAPRAIANRVAIKMRLTKHTAIAARRGGNTEARAHRASKTRQI